MLTTVVLAKRDFAVKLIWADLIAAAIAEGKLPADTSDEDPDIRITVKVISAD